MAQESGNSAYDPGTGLLATLPSNYCSLSKSGKRRARSAKQKRLANADPKPTLSAELPDGALQSSELDEEEHMERETEPVTRCWKPFKFFKCGHFVRIQCWGCSRDVKYKTLVYECPLVRYSEAGLWFIEQFCRFRPVPCCDCHLKTRRTWEGPIQYSLLIAAFKNEIQLDMLEESSEGDYKQILTNLRLRKRLPMDAGGKPLTMSDVWNFEADYCRSLVEQNSNTPRTERRMIWHGQKVLDEMPHQPCPGSTLTEDRGGTGSQHMFQSDDEMFDDLDFISWSHGTSGSRSVGKLRNALQTDLTDIATESLSYE